MRFGAASALAWMVAMIAPPIEPMRLGPEDLRRERHVGPPLFGDSGARMSASDVVAMSQRRSRQRASGTRR